MKRFQRMTTAALAAMLFASLGALAEARPGRGGGGGGDSTPVEPVQDVALVGATESGALISIEKTEEETSFSSVEFGSSQIASAVAGGVLTIDSFTITSEAGDAVTITVAAAELTENRFASSFSAEGTALVSTADGDAEIPVSVRGMIRESEGVYTLKASVRGFLADESVEEVTSYTVVKARLSATADVPADDSGDDDNGGDGDLE